MAANKLMLDYVYEHEAAQSGRVFLTQPLGGGQVKDYTWAQTMDQARRMAAHQAFERGYLIAIGPAGGAHQHMYAQFQAAAK